MTTRQTHTATRRVEFKMNSKQKKELTRLNKEITRLQAKAINRHLLLPM